MNTDLSCQIRRLVDAAAPVSPDEAIDRAGLGTTRILPADPSTGRAATHRVVLVGAAAACVLALVGGVLAWSGQRTSGARNMVPRVLTALEVETISDRSTSALASGGTAQVSETTASNGVMQSSDSIAVTFDGSNVNEAITFDPEPPGSAPSFSTDDRLVDGQFYIYTPGPNDVPEWIHDVGSGADASMQFPDPETLYSQLSANADFEVIGTELQDGVTLTHLIALDPAAIAIGPLASLASAHVSALELWVDPNDVVRQMTLDSSSTEQACTFDVNGGARRQSLERVLKGRGAIRLLLKAHGAKVWVVRYGAVLPSARAAGIPVTCAPLTTTSLVFVAFSNFGAAETIEAPSGAVKVDGKG
jgi:hypothetical protein